MNELSVSVVIPTLNRDEFLYDSINDMLNQDYTNYEIIVVDQSDNTNAKVEELVKKHPYKIRYYNNVGFKGLPQARNFGWQNAKNEIVLYIDDDIRAEKDFIQNHTYGFKNQEVGVAGGKVIEQGMGSGKNVGRFNPWTFKLTTEFSNQSTQIVDHVKGCNFSIKKHILENINGFDEQISIGAALYEELEMMLRVKNSHYKVLFNADASLHHLVAIDGGCRVKDIPKYMKGLAHNRSLIISRYLKFYHKPIVYGRLLLLGLSYSKTAKSLKPFFATIEGIKLGRVAGKLPVKCGQYKLVK